MPLRNDRIKQLRDARNWTQDDLAERAGVHKNTIQRYENATIKNPDLDLLIRIAEVLDTTLDYLAGIANDPNPQMVEVDLTDEERNLIFAIRRRDSNAILKAGAAAVASQDPN